MGITDGQPVDAANSNPAWLDANADDTAQGIITFANVAAPSGSTVTNTQREHNSIATFVGKALNAVFNSLPSWASNNRGTASDSVKQRVDAIDEAFDTSNAIGHIHNGATSQGPKISTFDLDNINLYFAEFQTTTFDSAVGIDDDVSSAFTTETPGGATAQEGIVTTAPNNRVELRTKTNGEQIEDGGGQKVYGRLTESAGVWTLTYYTNEAGTETSHSLSSQDIRLYYKKVFKTDNRPTFPSDVGDIGSLDMTADVVNATATQRGVVSTTTQTFAGVKTFNDQIQNEKELIVKEIATPSTPSSGYGKIYFKSDNLVYQLDDLGVESRLSSSSGGGGSLNWLEVSGSPVTLVDNNQRVYEFEVSLTQDLYTLIRIPNSYVSGSPVKLRMGFYAVGTTNNVLFQTQSTLIRAGTDAITTTTNQRTSTNAAQTLSAPSSKLFTVTFDLTSTSGQVNAVSVSAGDLLTVRLYRDGDTHTGSAFMPVYGAEVTFV